MEKPVLNIPEFCAAHRISRTYLYQLLKAGRGPRVMRMGKRVLITVEAAADWRKQMEQPAAEAA